MGFNSAYIG